MTATARLTQLRTDLVGQLAALLHSDPTVRAVAIGAAPDYDEVEPDSQLGMLRVITRRLSDPSSEWLCQAVTSYLIEGAIAA